LDLAATSGADRRRVNETELVMNTAFIGLDYIFDIVHPEGKITKGAGHALDDEMIERINQALVISRDKGWLTILVKVGFEPGYVNHPKDSPFLGPAARYGALELGTGGTAFHPSIRADLADMVVIKPRVSAFYGTTLESALRARKIERVVLAGVSTAWAVQAAARDAHDRDYRVVVVEDICAAATAVEHETSIALLRQIAKVMTVKEHDDL
jgi:nicotinamidase-related amidase